jgi:hypothetical protein
MDSFIQFITKLHEQTTHSIDTSYHVSLADRHNTIKQKGLDTRSGKVYVWKDLNNAKWFANLHADDGKSMDIWKVDSSNLPLHKDHETDDMSDWSSKFAPGTDGHGYIHHGKIEPSRLTHIDTVG